MLGASILDFNVSVEDICSYFHDLIKDSAYTLDIIDDKWFAKDVPSCEDEYEWEQLKAAFRTYKRSMAYILDVTSIACEKMPHMYRLLSYDEQREALENDSSRIGCMAEELCRDEGSQ